MIKIDLEKMILIDLLKKLKIKKDEDNNKELKLKMVVNNIVIQSNNQLMMLK